MPWLPQISVKIDKATTTNSPVSKKSVSCPPSKDNFEPNNEKKDDLKGGIALTNTKMENINQSSNSTNTVAEKLKEAINID